MLYLITDGSISVELQSALVVMIQTSDPDAAHEALSEEMQSFSRQAGVDFDQVVANEVGRPVWMDSCGSCYKGDRAI